MDYDFTDDPETDLDAETFKQLLIDLHVRRQHLIALICIILAELLQCSVALFTKPLRIPHHTSILTGKAWVLELMNGHPDRMKINFGVSLDMFSALVQVLEHNGIMESRNGVSVEEQLGIFFYTCVTGLSSRLVGERFQRSTETITK